MAPPSSNTTDLRTAAQALSGSTQEQIWRHFSLLTTSILFLKTKNKLWKNSLPSRVGPLTKTDVFTRLCLTKPSEPWAPLWAAPWGAEACVSLKQGKSMVHRRRALTFPKYLQNSSCCLNLQSEKKKVLLYFMIKIQDSEYYYINIKHLKWV